MKGLRNVGVVSAFIFLMGITACTQKTDAVTQNTPSTADGKQVTETAIAESETVVVESETMIVESETMIVGSEAMILEKLQNHHGIDRVLSAKHTREEWNVTLDRMISYGAKISEDEKNAIIDYLLSR